MQAIRRAVALAAAPVVSVIDFNRWSPGDTTWALRPTANGEFALTLPAYIRGPIAFKFTSGSWTTVETSAGGSDIPNRTVVILPAGATTYTTSIAAWKSSAGPVVKRSNARRSVRTVSDSLRHAHARSRPPRVNLSAARV